jgi:hypothetical protein
MSTTCPHCYGTGQDVPYDDQRACRECGGQGYVEDDDDWDGDEQDEHYSCGCPYCFCMNDVAYPGEVCGDCNAHAHQG